VDDVPTKLARLALIKATAQVLKNGLSILGVSAPTKM
jgi:arginyl-tRNA synthetase